MKLIELSIAIFTLFFFSCSEEKRISPNLNEDSDLITYKEYSLDPLSGEVLETDIMIEDFSSASTCGDIACHPQHYSEWSSSFHAHALRDPIFMKLWSLEKDHRPQTGTSYCAQCHTPAAFVTGYSLDGIEEPSDVESADIPDIIKEGVSCDICHTRVDKSPSVHTQDHVAASAQYYLNPGEGVKYGSIQEPETNSFHESQYLPIFNSSSSCNPCHNQFIRGMPIEATFSEWNNHPGLSMGGESCQDCHMPKDAGHSSHYFAGVDLLFYEGVDTDSPQYEQVVKLLQEAVTIDFEYFDGIENSHYIENNILNLPVSITNLTGHRLPSGTAFSREVWLELTVKTSDGEILFQKGGLENSSQELNYNDSDLMLYTHILYDQEDLQGNIIYEVQNTLSYDDRTLRTLFHDVKTYQIDVNNIQGELTIIARMLFRAFKPQIFTEFQLPSIIHLPIIEMYSDTLSVTIP